MSEFAGLVLVGGRSERMGRPKAGLDWHGEPLVLVVCRALERAGAERIVVARAAGQALPPLPGGVELVEDATPGLGPLVGMSAGLGAIPGDIERAFVSGVDAPFLAPAFVARVVAALAEGVDAVVPVRGGRRHPLAAAYRVTPTLEAIERRLAGNDLRVGGLLDELRVRFLDAVELLDDPELRAADPALDSLVNLNTPEDYADAGAASRER
jgi:molybdopterin-guanine dinucleotide biosynthesis protein A